MVTQVVTRFPFASPYPIDYPRTVFHGILSYMNKPLVSVLIPVYNAEKYLTEAINSVLSQTFSNFELICIDDGSTDNSLSILESFAKQDARVRIYSNVGNKGIAYTATKLAKLARGQYLAKMDADDVMVTDRLAKQVSFLQANPDIVVVGGQCILIDAQGREVGKKVLPTLHRDIYRQIFALNSMHQPTVMINTTLVPKNALVYDSAVTPVDDYDMFFRLFEYGDFANLEDIVLKYRVYGESSTMKNIKNTFKLIQDVRICALFDYGYIPTISALATSFIQEVVVCVLPVSLIISWLNFARGLDYKDSTVWGKLTSVFSIRPIRSIRTISC